MYENERFVLKSKKLSDPIKAIKFDNFLTTFEKESKTTPNKKLQNATDISLFKKHSCWLINEDLTQKR